MIGSVTSFSNNPLCVPDFIPIHFVYQTKDLTQNVSIRDPTI